MQTTKGQNEEVTVVTQTSTPLLDSFLKQINILDVLDTLEDASVSFDLDLDLELQGAVLASDSSSIKEQIFAKREHMYHLLHFLRSLVNPHTKNV